MMSLAAILASGSKAPDPPTGLWIANQYDNPGYADAGWNAVSGATKYEYRLDDGGGFGGAIDNGTATGVYSLGPYDRYIQLCIQVKVTTTGGTSDWSASECIIIDLD